MFEQLFLLLPGFPLSQAGTKHTYSVATVHLMGWRGCWRLLRHYVLYFLLVAPLTFAGVLIQEQTLDMANCEAH